ncbi:hypothetical protein ERN12_16480 [Rhodobacteraceae bacterium]|nr:hypothetical protein ERN12_16480 [Paracoccaceae bacterium]
MTLPVVHIRCGFNIARPKSALHRMKAGYVHFARVVVSARSSAALGLVWPRLGCMGLSVYRAFAGSGQSAVCQWARFEAQWVKGLVA